MKETLATLAFLLFFAGGMLAISGSIFVTHGGVSSATYFRVGIIELIGAVIGGLGLYLMAKTR